MCQDGMVPVDSEHNELRVESHSYTAPRDTVAVADEGVPFRDIAGIVGRHLNLPVPSISGDEVGKHFGAFAMFAKIDVIGSSAKTQHTLGWHPTELAS